MTRSEQPRLSARILSAATTVIFLASLAACTTTDTATPETTSNTANGEGAGESALVDGDAGTFVVEQIAATGTPINPTSAEILDVRGGPDDAELTLAFEMGDAACHGFEATVDETDTEIVVGIVTGRLADVDPLDCEFGVHSYTTEVDLVAPLGDRKVVAAEPVEPPALPTADSLDGPGADVDFLIGSFVEDAVEWAVSNDLDWRIISFDGETFQEQPQPDPGRLAFVVVGDRVVAYEWS